MLQPYYLTIAGKIEQDLIVSLREKLLSRRERTTVFLVGDLGSGKTHLVKLLIGDFVTSPTFSLRNEYEVNLGGNSKAVAHWDLYRVLNVPGEIFVESADIIFIEWPDKFDQLYKELLADLIIFITDDHYAFVYELPIFETARGA